MYASMPSNPDSASPSALPVTSTRMDGSCLATASMRRASTFLASTDLGCMYAARYSGIIFLSNPFLTSVRPSMAASCASRPTGGTAMR